MSFRIRGFLLHLLASSLLAIGTICLVFLVWYPSPLHQAIGVTNIFLILLSVDVVIGPLLTLAVCKQGKKSLVFDLSLIIVLQLSAFLYGIYTIAQGRPVWIAYYNDRFDIVQAFEMDHAYREKAKIEFQKLSFTGPEFVAVKIPEGNSNIIAEGLFTGVDIPQRADLYQPYASETKLVSKKAQDLSELKKYNSADNVEKELSKWPQANSFLPLKTNAQSMSVLLKRETGEVVAIVPLNPWK